MIVARFLAISSRICTVVSLEEVPKVLDTVNPRQLITIQYNPLVSNINLKAEIDVF